MRSPNGAPARHFAGGPIQHGALGTAGTIASGQRNDKGTHRDFIWISS